MNTPTLKKYAPNARRDFIRAVTDRAAYYGLTKEKIEPVTEEGDVAIIAGKPFPRRIATLRSKLESRIKQQGFEQVMKAMAYTWFNRMMAIRFMELHGYLEHGYRVLSHPDGTATPEIIENAEHVDLPGLDKQKVIELKLEGTKESELYNMLFLAQCHALHRAMPFLFEAIEDETELLLPENLLHSDSVIRKMVGEIDEADWQEVEIVGWLYQFYISEKKDEVIGKVVKSEDIPAATQLFTPNWIVKYLVQNSLGRQWVATYPDSPLKGQMEYYIEPTEQTTEVQEQLDAITPESLNPEELTLLDPACGSGHILVEAYDLLKAIYQERGYRAKDIPRLILEKNLYGLEIDDRAAQLAAFALMMKARADDRRIFEADVQPHVLAIQEGHGLDADEICAALVSGQSSVVSGQEGTIDNGQLITAMKQLITLFEDGKTFGSLIQVPDKLVNRLPVIAELIEAVQVHGGMFERAVVKQLRPLLKQAQMLGCRYDVVATNPPYMGTSYMTPRLRKLLKDDLPAGRKDLFAGFFIRCRLLARSHGHLGFMSPFVWMFIEAYEDIRVTFIENATITTVVQLEYSGFAEATVPVCTFTLRNSAFLDFTGVYIRLSDFKGPENQAPMTLEAIRNPQCGWCYHVRSSEFKAIPGRPIAFWVSRATRTVFTSCTPLGEIARPRKGLVTSDNNRFLRLWHEVDWETVAVDTKSHDAAHTSGKRWFTYNCGGDFRKWYGNLRHVINWENDGEEIIAYAARLYGSATRQIQNTSYYFRPAVTWSNITSSEFGVREIGDGFIFGGAGSCAFPNEANRGLVTGFLNSRLASELIKAINPTLNFVVRNVASLPVLPDAFEQVREIVTANVDAAVEMAKTDWNSSEIAWEFSGNPLVRIDGIETVGDAYMQWAEACEERLNRMQRLESENNEQFLRAYNLANDYSADVPDDRITLYAPDRQEDIQRLISYAVGCVMGRYSLDKPGLIYAHSGNQSFNPSQYRTIPVDEDGIIPVTDTAWFDDDAANRFVQFVSVAWPKEYLETNLSFIAESLKSKKGESPRDTVRRYLATGFFKHHLKMYKKRPIYWLFSSGKQRAFQCLVYLHRYNEGTLGRMRTDYVIPLQGKIEARIDQLADDVEAATSTSHRNRLQKERDKLIKQQAELRTFDEKLRHYADQRIALDLDDGVKVNYGKFGDLLAEVKAVTGKKPV